MINLYNVYAKIVSESNFKSMQGTGRPSDLATCLKTLVPKQIPQRLSIALSHVKAGNTSDKLLNEIKQIVYFFRRPKGITKKRCKNITKAIQT